MTQRFPVGYGANHDAPPIRIHHANLMPIERSTSAYRRQCPKCGEGVLMVGRERDYPFRIVNHDRCTRCYQLFIYEDKTIGGEEVVKEVPPS